MVGIIIFRSSDDSTNNYQDFLSGRINKTFICAYFVSK